MATPQGDTLIDCNAGQLQCDRHVDFAKFASTSPRNMMRTFLLSATLAISMSTVVLCDLFDDLDDVDESPEALRNITGPGIPE